MPLLLLSIAARCGYLYSVVCVCCAQRLRWLCTISLGNVQSKCTKCIRLMLNFKCCNRNSIKRFIDIVWFDIQLNEHDLKCKKSKCTFCLIQLIMIPCMCAVCVYDIAKWTKSVMAKHQFQWSWLQFFFSMWMVVILNTFFVMWIT